MTGRYSQLCFRNHEHYLCTTLSSTVYFSRITNAHPRFCARHLASSAGELFSTPVSGLSQSTSMPKPAITKTAPNGPWTSHCPCGEVILPHAPATQRKSTLCLRAISRCALGSPALKRSPKRPACAPPRAWISAASAPLLAATSVPIPASPSDRCIYTFFAFRTASATDSPSLPCLGPGWRRCHRWCWAQTGRVSAEPPPVLLCCGGPVRGCLGARRARPRRGPRPAPRAACPPLRTSPVHAARWGARSAENCYKD